MTYPPLEDLYVDRTSDLPKDLSITAAGPLSHYPSKPPFHSYRTRYASLDDNMYDAPSSSSSSSSRLASWSPTLSLSSSSISASLYFSCD